MITADGEIVDHIFRIDIRVKTGARESVNAQVSTQILAAKMLLRGIGYKADSENITIDQIQSRSALDWQ